VACGAGGVPGERRRLFPRPSFFHREMVAELEERSRGADCSAPWEKGRRPGVRSGERRPPPPPRRLGELPSAKKRRLGPPDGGLAASTGWSSFGPPSAVVRS